MQIMGVPLLIEWEKFSPGASIFIPCLNRREVKRMVEQEAERLRLRIICKFVVDKQRYGLRVWRVPDTV